MDARRLMGWGLVVLCTACSGAKQAVRAPSEQATGGSGPVAMQSQPSQTMPGAPCPAAASTAGAGGRAGACSTGTSCNLASAS